MEQSSRRVADLSDNIFRLMRQWGSATMSDLENELPGIDRPTIEAALKRLVDLRKVKTPDHSGIFRPR
jgi:predicted HTH transcriptional regulator